MKNRINERIRDVKKCTITYVITKHFNILKEIDKEKSWYLTSHENIP